MWIKSTFLGEVEETQRIRIQAKQLDKTRFLNKGKPDIYHQLESTTIIAKRRVEFLLGKFEEFQTEIQRRKWTKLITPCLYFHEDTIRVFCTNAYPTNFNELHIISCVRGVHICYDADVIGRHLQINFHLTKIMKRR